MTDHKFKIGQLVNYLGCERASGVYQITHLLPPESEAFQYRIKNVNEPHERVAKESELRSAWLAAPATAAEALRYAVEDLRTPKAFGAWLEVGDERFNSIEIQRLYEASDYPLRKPDDRASARTSSQRD